MQDIRKNSLFKATYFAAFYLCIAVQDLFLLIDIQNQKLAPIVAKTFIYKQIMDGERITLTLWFSRDASHDEDAKLISLLSDQSLHSSKTDFASCLPVAASNKMYWFPPEEASDFQSGFDIRCARLHVLGLDLYFSDEESSLSALDSSHYLAELLKESLQLARGDELLVWKFVNILHAVQVPFLCKKVNSKVWYSFYMGILNEHGALSVSAILCQPNDVLNKFLMFSFGSSWLKFYYL